MAVVDMHCDTISVLLDRERKGFSSFLKENDLHIDLKKLKKGDYLLQNFALFVYLGNDKDPFDEALHMADLYYRELEKNTDLISPIFCYQDIEKNRKEGKLSALLTLEEGGICKGSLVYLRILYHLGVRMMTLTWNFPNELGYPNLLSKETQPDFYHPDTEHGLTPKGLEFLSEMERLGIIIDVSHLSDAGFYDVYHHTSKPFVASHSNTRAICPWVRNLTDDMIQKLASRGGVIGLNFCADFLTDVPVGTENPGTIDAIVTHAKHLAKVGGIECIGLGTDFDGISTHKELPDASYLPLLADALKNSGFTEREIDKIFSENVLRVYKDIL